MTYQEYRGCALEEIGRELLSRLENPWDIYQSTPEQAKEAFLWYTSTYTGSPLARFQWQHGELFLEQLPLSWPFFLSDMRHGLI